jgi:hypothetical protein
VLIFTFFPLFFAKIKTMGIWLPMPKVRSRLIVASLLLLLAVNPLNAQRSAIDTYAITNARIVTVSGPVIERGTVVIRNGLIAAAGANVSAPPDARVIDGAGLTVYPGLIDSYTNLALPEAAPGPRRAVAVVAVSSFSNNSSSGRRVVQTRLSLPDCNRK